MNKSKQKKKSSLQPSAKETKEAKKVQERRSSEEHEDSDDDAGYDEKGMERLMTALGEDGLDDIAQTMLRALDGQNNEVEGSDQSEHGSSGGEEEDESGDEESDGSNEDSSENENEGEEYVPKVKLRAELSSDDDDDDDDDGGGEESESDSEESEGDEAGKDKKNRNTPKSLTSGKPIKNTNTSQKDASDEVSGVPLDEVSDVDEDAIPQQKLMVNNKHALDSILQSIRLDQSLPWTETLTTIYPEAHEIDVSNDLDRELSFYKQALHGVEASKKLAAEHSLPFTRPSDFFAEMVKSDVHMERIRQRLLDETAQIKRGEEKRREREGKKFGKQVQLEKLKERERSKKELGEKIQSLKRKRKDGAFDDGQDGDFDVALEEAVGDRPTKKPKMPRGKRNEKYGFGGKGSVGWRSKQNTKDSTDQFVSGNDGKKGKKGGKGGRHTPQRPGKARRMAKRQK